VLKLLLVVLVFAVVVYAAMRFLQRRGGAPGTGARRPAKPLPPDDDPNFLRDLDFQRWQQQRRRSQSPQKSDGESGGAPGDPSDPGDSGGPHDR
jgi:hypothetical protein